MPFGLCNAPQTLCRLMDHVIPAYLKSQVFVYLDDLLIITETFDKHLDVLLEIAQCLRRAGLTINVQKSKFCIKQVNYLGYIVGDGTLRPNPDRIDCVVNFPAPKTIKQLRRFLGMAGWYRRFVENYAEITVPMTNLLRKNKKFTWTEEAQIAFDVLKQKLTSKPVLANPDYSKPFIIQCDASKLGVGAVLAQKSDDGMEMPVAYFSHKLNKAQSNYSVTELECLAAILSLKKFRAYVEGQQFSINTDHASLQWLMRQADLSGRLARWSLKLQGYKFKIEHRKGTLNVVPDCLSRQFEVISSLDQTFPIVDLESAEFKSSEYEKLKSEVQQNHNRLPDVKVVDNHVYKRTEFADGDVENEAFNWKLWIPKTLVNEVLKNAHEPANKSHGGISKTLERLRKNLYWPKMVDDVKTYINSCEECHKNKSTNVQLKPPMIKQYQVQRPFQKLYIDFLGPYPRSKQGHIGLFIVLDHLTKFVLLHPVKKFTAEPVCEILQKFVFNIFGTPEIVMSDNGKQFKSGYFTKFLNNRGIKQHLTALYSPQANASERVNRSIITAIRTYLKNDQSHWDKYIGDICEALRSSHHQSIGYTPYFALFGQQMVTHGRDYELLRKLHTLDERVIERTDKLKLIRSELQNNIKEAFESAAKRYNLRSSNRTVKVGDTVLRRNFVLSDATKKFAAKLAPKFIKATVVR